LPKINEISGRMIGSDSLHYFKKLYVERLKADLINKLSYFYIFNMIRKSRGCKDNLKMGLRITHSSQ
jgi:hypothetical protein